MTTNKEEPKKPFVMQQGINGIAVLLAEKEVAVAKMQIAQKETELAKTKVQGSFWLGLSIGAGSTAFIWLVTLAIQG